MTTINPRTPAEVLRFQKGTPTQLKAIEQAGAELSQMLNRCADAMFEYEFVLGFAAKSSHKAVAKAAKQVLEKHRIK